jgi:hypothetical protein
LRAIRYPPPLSLPLSPPSPPSPQGERRAVGASLLPIAAFGPRAEALDLLAREEPQVVARRFDPVASSLGLNPLPPSPSSPSGVAGVTGVAGVAGMGAWDCVALLNWHWRPKPLRAAVPVAAAWPAGSGPHPRPGPAQAPSRGAGGWPPKPARSPPPFAGASETRARFITYKHGALSVRKSRLRSGTSPFSVWA